MKAFESIWRINPGDGLVAQETMHMEDSGEQVFTKGKRYLVLRVLPLRDPPVAVVVDDAGQENNIEPDFVHNFTLDRA